MACSPRPARSREHLSFAAEVMPADAYSIVQNQIARVVAKGEAKLSFAFVFGFGLALWSANAGMKAIIDALNVVYEANEKRGIVRLNVSGAATTRALAAALAAIGAAIKLRGELWSAQPKPTAGVRRASGRASH
jgi:membrane protein